MKLFLVLSNTTLVTRVQTIIYLDTISEEAFLLLMREIEAQYRTKIEAKRNAYLKMGGDNEEESGEEIEAEKR